MNASPETTRIRNGTSPSTSGKKPPKESSTQSLDSTWIFPVGSDVVHCNFGKGIVLQPSKDSSEGLLVRVQFEDGRTRDFPATSNDISLDLGF